MTSTPSSKQPSGRAVALIYAVATAAGVAAVTFATLYAVYWPIPFAVAAAVATGLDRALRASGRQIDGNHIAIVALSAAVGGLTTTTFVLASESRGANKPTVQLLSPPPTDITVPEKFEGVSGTVSGLAPGETIWLMSRTVGEDRAYLMSEPCTVSPSGHWGCPAIYFGTSAPNHQRYEILVQILNSQDQQRAVREWEETYTRHENALSYPGPLGETATKVEVHRER